MAANKVRTQSSHYNSPFYLSLSPGPLLFGSDRCLFCRERANVHMDGHFLLRVVYEDKITFDLVQAATEILGQCDPDPLVLTAFRN